MLTETVLPGATVPVTPDEESVRENLGSQADLRENARVNVGKD